MLKVYGLCRLVADPELKEIGETCVATFRVVINEYRKSKTDQGEFINTPHFFECKLWDTGARRLVEKAKKGDQVIINAEPRQENWTDKEGNNRSKVVFRVSEFQVIPKSKVTENEEASV